MELNKFNQTMKYLTRPAERPAKTLSDDPLETPPVFQTGDPQEAVKEVIRRTQGQVPGIRVAPSVELNLFGTAEDQDPSIQGQLDVGGGELGFSVGEDKGAITFRKQFDVGGLSRDIVTGKFKTPFETKKFINNFVDKVREGKTPLFNLFEQQELIRKPSVKNPEKLSKVNRNFINKLRNEGVLRSLGNRIATGQNVEIFKKATIKNINELNKKFPPLDPGRGVEGKLSQKAEQLSKDILGEGKLKQQFLDAKKFAKKFKKAGYELEHGMPEALAKETGAPRDSYLKITSLMPKELHDKKTKVDLSIIKKVKKINRVEDNKIKKKLFEELIKFKNQQNIKLGGALDVYNLELVNGKIKSSVTSPLFSEIDEKGVKELIKKGDTYLKKSKTDAPKFGKFAGQVAKGAKGTLKLAGKGARMLVGPVEAPLSIAALGLFANYSDRVDFEKAVRQLNFSENKKKDLINQFRRSQLDLDTGVGEEILVDTMGTKSDIIGGIKDPKQLRQFQKIARDAINAVRAQEFADLEDERRDAALIEKDELS